MDAPYPLMPMPEGTINLPEGLTAEERLQEAFVQAVDHVNFNAMAWPARNRDGELVRPPDEHVLHELAHYFELAEEEELWTHPPVRTVGFVDELPVCDLCSNPARYDAHVTDGNGRTGGAYLCDNHYREHGSGTLGAGGDSYIMLWSEIPKEIRDICNQIRRQQGKEPALRD